MPMNVGWEADATRIAMARSETLDQGLRSEAIGLEQLALRIQKQQEEAWEISDKKETALNRLAKLDHINTALTVISSGFRFGAGAGIVAANPVIGCVLMGTALFSISRALSEKLEWTESISASMGGTKDEIKQRTQLLNRSMAGFDLVLTFSSVLLGDSKEIIQAGWNAITATKVTKEGLTSLTSGTQGLLMLIRARLEGRKGDVELDGLQNRKEGVEHQVQRNMRQEQLESVMQLHEGLFERHLQTIQTNQKLNLKIRQNMGE